MGEASETTFKGARWLRATLPKARAFWLGLQISRQKQRIYFRNGIK